MALSSIAMSFLDMAGEAGRIRLNMALADAGTIANQLLDCDKAHAGSLAKAICDITTLELTNTDFVASSKKGSQVKPTNVLAHRELGLLVKYTDNVTGENYHVTIPGPDIQAVPILAHDEVDQTAAKFVELKRAMEASVLSPVGNAITVTGGRLVGRNR